MRTTQIFFVLLLFAAVLFGAKNDHKVHPAGKSKSPRMHSPVMKSRARMANSRAARARASQRRAGSASRAAARSRRHATTAQ
jgi:hypothetical protein